MNGILIIAHAPLASALRLGLLHVFPDAAACVQALDVPADEAPETTLQHARSAQASLGTPGTLVLADVFGATPCNVASQLVDGVHSRLLTGVNLPMLLRATCYRHEPLDELVARALQGATQGVMSVATVPPDS
ncbi:PTS sugar transporter subunit IIA [Macromonas bipunctata]|jgi:mannose PTS system EIIA component|uniref:PTS sugar transporter subunit IIA n=1 Tax=Macromonas bipunctata TaxID=183670 RepID=UPI000C3458F7|nr:PTS fructose transporter subunit IIA [Macromonas bipunctata]